jgi:hypothetical protein
MSRLTPLPLSASQRRGEIGAICYGLHPLCEAERVEQRSAFGVSQICERQKQIIIVSNTQNSPLL